jgi:hypothetical protein
MDVIMGSLLCRTQLAGDMSYSTMRLRDALRSFAWRRAISDNTPHLSCVTLSATVDGGAVTHEVRCNFCSRQELSLYSSSHL